MRVHVDQDPDLPHDPCAGVYFNDLWQFDVEARTWIRLVSTTDADVDDTPIPRRDFAAVAVDGYIYIFGGSSNDDRGVAKQLMHDMRIRKLPKIWDWPRNGVEGFLKVYDEDKIRVNGNVVLDTAINLCSGNYIPCALRVLGTSSSSISRKRGGQIGCHASLGCTSVMLQKVELLCNIQDMTTVGPLQVSGVGASLSIMNTTISSCSSVQVGLSTCEFHMFALRLFC